MDFYTKRFLKGLRRLSGGAPAVLYFPPNRDSHLIHKMDSTESYDYSKTGDLADVLIPILLKEGYIEIVEIDNAFRLTHKGLHPYLVGWEQIKQFLLRSIVTPILVSAVTTLLTLWLKELL